MFKNEHNIISNSTVISFLRIKGTQTGGGGGGDAYNVK